MSENEKDKKKDIKPEPTLKVTLGGEKYDSHAILNNSLKLSENSILSADPYKVENKFTTLAGELYSKSIINNINFEKDNLGLLNYKPKYLEDAVLKISGASDFSKYINSGLSSASAITQSILYAQPTTIVAEARKINNQKNETEDKIKNLQTEILQVKNNQKEKDTKIKELESELEKYRTLSQYQNLLTRVGALAKEELIVNEELRNNFSNNSVRPGAVISIDIRNSTELMLLAKSPVDFAQFITSLILVLEKIVKDNFGIFDKFTGDGLLAFFPDFFCGKDSLYFALQTAKLCQNAFSIEYEKVELGQTEEGSYVINLYIPNNYYTEDTLPLIADDSFSRKSLNIIEDSMEALVITSAEYTLTNDVSVFDDLYEKGISSNLCYAIAEMSSDGKSDVCVSIIKNDGLEKDYIVKEITLKKEIIPVIKNYRRLLSERFN